MKAVCIIGSPRKNGSTAYLVDTFIKGLSKKFEVVRYCIGDMNIHYCKGCKACYIDGKCIQKDDVEQMVINILTADLVLIATPSYWGDVTGQLKTFFDRSTPYGNTNPNRKLQSSGAKGIAVSIRAGKTETENQRILDSLEHYFGHMIETIAKISVCDVDSLEDLLKKQQEKIEEIYQLGLKISLL